MAQIKKIVPPYVRIERIYRDVPSENIIDGCSHLNIREMVQTQMRQKGLSCKCIRCREIGHQLKMKNEKLKMTIKNLKLFIDKYIASDGQEYFQYIVDNTSFTFTEMPDSVYYGRVYVTALVGEHPMKKLEPNLKKLNGYLYARRDCINRLIFQQSSLYKVALNESSATDIDNLLDSKIDTFLYSKFVEKYPQLYKYNSHLRE